MIERPIWNERFVPVARRIASGDGLTRWFGDEAEYKEEVRITYFHELGHYLGLEEDDLEDRGL